MSKRPANMTREQWYSKQIGNFIIGAGTITLAVWLFFSMFGMSAALAMEAGVVRSIGIGMTIGFTVATVALVAQAVVFKLYKHEESQGLTFEDEIGQVEDELRDAMRKAFSATKSTRERANRVETDRD